MMRSVPAILLLVAAGIATASAQTAPDAARIEAPASAAPAQPQPVTAPAPPAFAMDHGRTADAEAAAKADAAAAEARAAAIAAGAPLEPSESTNFRINGADVLRVVTPTSEQQKVDAQAREAWQARCRPTVVTDREGLRRTKYAAPDCDLSRFNTAGK